MSNMETEEMKEYIEEFHRKRSELSEKEIKELLITKEIADYYESKR